MAWFLALVFGALEYLLATQIGIPELLAWAIAGQVAVCAAALAWLGGVPTGGSGLGRRW